MFEGEQPLFNFVVPDELLAARGQQEPGQGGRGRRGPHARHRRGQASAADRHPARARVRAPGPAHGGGHGHRHHRQRHRHPGPGDQELLPPERRRAGGGDLRRRRGPDRLGDAGGGVRRPRQPQERGRHHPAHLLGHGPAHGPRAQRVALRLPLPDRRHRPGLERHRPQRLSGRRLSHPGPGPRLRLAQHERPRVPDHRDPARGLHRGGHPQLALGPGPGGPRRARGARPSSSSASPRRGPTSRATS